VLFSAIGPRWYKWRLTGASTWSICAVVQDVDRDGLERHHG